VILFESHPMMAYCGTEWPICINVANRVFLIISSNLGVVSWHLLRESERDKKKLAIMIKIKKINC